MGEHQVIDGDGLNLADLGAAVAATALAMQDRHLLPGQAPELRGECGLIVFDGEQVVGVALLHEVDGVGALGVHGIRRDHRVGQVGRGDLVQQGRELTDLLVFAAISRAARVTASV